MRGRKPKVRYDQDQEPPIVPPTCPAHLDAEARREWRRVVRLLNADRLDRSVLSIYCQLWSRLLTAESELEKDGLVVKSPNGYGIPSPWVAIANQCMDRIAKLASELGLTPVSRTRIKAAKKPKPVSEWGDDLASVRVHHAG